MKASDTPPTQEDLSGLVGRLMVTRSDTAGMDALLSEAATALTETAAELERVRKALEPFANLADPMLRQHPEPDVEILAWASPLGGDLMLSDFRRARQALSPEAEGDLGSSLVSTDMSAPGAPSVSTEGH